MKVNDRIPPAKAPRVHYYIHEPLSADIADTKTVSAAEHICWFASLCAQGGHRGRFRAPYSQS